MIKLKDILLEQKTPETIDQIWDGAKIPYGTRDKVANGIIRQIQTQIVSLLPDNEKWRPDGVFGDDTANAIAKLMGITLNNPKSLSIGPNTLIALGFQKPEPLTLTTKILAATITGEGMGDKNDMQGIANVILNRSISRNMKLTNVVFEPKQFSIWNKITGDNDEEKTNNVIRNWGGGLKSAGNIEYWKFGVALAKQIQNRTLTDNTGGATHYFTGPRPDWATGKQWILHKVIGKHEYGRSTSVSWAKSPVTR